MTVSTRDIAVLVAAEVVTSASAHWTEKGKKKSGPPAFRKSRSRTKRNTAVELSKKQEFVFHRGSNFFLTEKRKAIWKPVLFGW